MLLRSKTHYGEKALSCAYQFVKTWFCGSSVDAGNSKPDTGPGPGQGGSVNLEAKGDFVSHANYKINYDRCLGRGTFGCVYEISARPENEKGCFSRTFPYVYDYWYPNTNSTPSSTRYCVKIAKTTFRICLEYIRKPHKAIAYPIFSFFNHSLETKLHCLLRKHGLTQMEFIPTSGVYSQFKTRINGETFGYYAENNYFLREDQFELRKSFVEFLRLVMKSPLVL
jgi:hypothetical protein